MAEPGEGALEAGADARPLAADADRRSLANAAQPRSPAAGAGTPPFENAEAARLLSSKRLYHGKVLALDLDEVVEPGGVRARREVVRQPGSVACLAVHDDGRVVLVRQWRHAVGAAVWELPAGRLDPGETPEAGARRELEEETGLRAARLEKISEYWTTPGFCDEAMHLFRATGLTRVPPRPEPDERLEPLETSYEQARAMMARGELREGKTLVALLLEGERRTQAGALEASPAEGGR